MGDSDAVLRATQTLLVDRVAAETVTAFAHAGIESILLKGKTFSLLLYPTGGRGYGDVDLLVRRVDIPRAAAVLNRLGYRDGQEGFALAERHIEASTFSRPNSRGVTVDLHANLHWLPDADRTWRVLRAETEQMILGDLTVTMLSRAARVMHVVLHAAHHGLEGPQPGGHGHQTGEDLRRALATIEMDEWKRARDIADAIGAADLFAFGLRLDPGGAALAEQLGLGAPVDVWSEQAPFHQLQARGARTLHRLRSAPTAREKAAIVSRWIVPSRARVRQVADSRIGRVSLPGAYAEYWFDLVRALPKGVRASQVFRR